MMSSSRPHGGASDEVNRTPRDGLDEKDPDLGILCSTWSRSLWDGDVAREDAPLESLDAGEELVVEVEVAVENAEDGVDGADAAGEAPESRPSRGD